MLNRQVSIAGQPYVIIGVLADGSRLPSPAEAYSPIEYDNTYDAGISATWKINRTLWLTAGYVHEWYVSSDPAANYSSDTIKVELKAQR